MRKVHQDTQLLGRHTMAHSEAELLHKTTRTRGLEQVQVQGSGSPQDQPPLDPPLDRLALTTTTSRSHQEPTPQLTPRLSYLLPQKLLDPCLHLERCLLWTLASLTPSHKVTCSSPQRTSLELRNTVNTPAVPFSTKTCPLPSRIYRRLSNCSPLGKNNASVLCLSPISISEPRPRRPDPRPANTAACPGPKQ